MSSKEITVETKRGTNYLYTKNRSASTPTVFLHGFTGASDSWKEIINRCDFYAIAPDIVGHGKSRFIDIDGDYTEDDWCEDLSEILDSLDVDTLNLCGYSMGGRLAVAYAAKNPERVSTLVLESTGPGIKDKKAREERFQQDLKICEHIERDLYDFVQKWEDNRLFAYQRLRNEMGFLEQRNSRLSHDPAQLAKALRVFSQANMRPYQKEFSKFKMPVVVINGEEDSSYTQMGKDMADTCETSAQYIVPDCGHNTHLERPERFADYLTSALNRHNNA